jgi:hypothetical protein
MRRAAGGAYEGLNRLTDRDLDQLQEPQTAAFVLASAVAGRPGLAEWQRFKFAISTLYARELRAALDAAPDGRSRALGCLVFPPPLSLLTGVDFGAMAAAGGDIVPKLYTMHWPLIVYYWATELLEANPGLDEAKLVRALAVAFDFQDGDYGSSIADYKYPPPDRPHQAGAGAQRRKIRQTVAAVAGRGRVLPSVHGYGPLDDFVGRLRIAWEAATEGIWINRYAYLGSKKLAAIAALGNHRDDGQG